MDSSCVRGLVWYGLVLVCSGLVWSGLVWSGLGVVWCLTRSFQGQCTPTYAVSKHPRIRARPCRRPHVQQADGDPRIASEDDPAHVKEVLREVRATGDRADGDGEAAGSVGDVRGASTSR